MNNEQQFRGCWIDCKKEMPTEDGEYKTLIGSVVQAGSLYNAHFHDRFETGFEPDHWLKLHDMPPLPQPEPVKDAFEEWWLEHKSKNACFKNEACEHSAYLSSRMAYAAAIASMKKDTQ